MSESLIKPWPLNEECIAFLALLQNCHQFHDDIVIYLVIYQSFSSLSFRGVFLSDLVDAKIIFNVTITLNVLIAQNWKRFIVLNKRVFHIMVGTQPFASRMK